MRRRGRALRAETEAIAQRRGVAVTWATISEQRATRCTPALVDEVAEAVTATGVPVRELPSGAGHDTVTMARSPTSRCCSCAARAASATTPTSRSP